MTAGYDPIPSPRPRRRRYRIAGGTLLEWLVVWLLVSAIIAMLWGAL